MGVAICIASNDGNLLKRGQFILSALYKSIWVICNSSVQTPAVFAHEMNEGISDKPLFPAYALCSTLKTRLLPPHEKIWCDIEFRLSQAKKCLRYRNHTNLEGVFTMRKILKGSI